MDRLAISRRERGEVNQTDIASFVSLKESKLLSLLNSKISTERTIAAILLRNHKNATVVYQLCKTLTVEKKLYTKIALCESLVECAELSIEPLINLLGRIGNNLETKIPKKGFYKTSFPLPSDIAARTLCRLGTRAIKPLENFIKSAEEIFKLAQAIDAYGHINFSNKLGCSSKILKALVVKNSENDFLKFKITRCLSGIYDSWSRTFLLDTLQSGCHGLRLEALRSLLLLKVEVPIEMQSDFTTEMHKLKSFFNKKLTSP